MASVRRLAQVGISLVAVHSHALVCSSASSSDVSGDPSLTKRLDAALLGCVLAIVSVDEVLEAAGAC